MLIERVRRALAPDYEVLAEIGGGGMGLVYAARQIRLDRKVAVKILRPEHATAAAVARFLAESRLLARFTHPNVIPVHDAGEADGLLYYVMEFVEGETLAKRLRRGPLPREEALRLARDLLGALAAAHRLGIVHRDVKPGNIFCRRDGALLGDFGIARLREPDVSDPTRTGELIGTPGYMAPEQREGRPAAPATDVYGAGLVVYEACTGRRWTAYQPPDQADWRAVPAELAGPLRRALQLDPAARWADAAAFATSLGGGGSRRRRAATALILATATLGVLIVWPRREPAAETTWAEVTLVIPSFHVEGLGGPPGLGDSLAARLREDLSEYPSFVVRERDPDQRDSAVRISGQVQLTWDRATIQLQGTKLKPVILDNVPIGYWEAQLDSLKYMLLWSLWESPVLQDRWRPPEILPQTHRGLGLWLLGEQAWDHSELEKARQAYLAAVRQDPTCLICSFRLTDLERWLEATHDARHSQTVREGIARFPHEYQVLIRARDTTTPERIDLLREETDRESQFYLTWMYLGDEQFHRGPLYGWRRTDAIESFGRAVGLRPRFAPGWEHLAWAAIGEGDSARAREALDSLHRVGGSGAFASMVAAFLETGYAWRFLSLDSARHHTEEGLRRMLPGSTSAVGAARLLMSMNAPDGAVEVGRLLARRSGIAGALSNGLLGQLFGQAALGRLDSVRGLGRRLGERTGDPGLSLIALEVEALLRAFDPNPQVRQAPELASELQQIALGDERSPERRSRAAFALGMLALGSGDQAGLELAGRSLAAEPEPARLRAILTAAVTGARGDYAGALDSLPPRLEPDAANVLTPLDEAAIRFLRAGWLVLTQRVRPAAEELRWHEHLHISGHLTAAPQPGEVAWAAGTLARWQRRVALAGWRGAEWCSVNREIARAWRNAPQPFGARADSAQRSADDPGCTETQ